MMGRKYSCQDSTLSAAYLSRLLTKSYRLPRPASCLFFRKGICDSYDVKAGRARYFLKVYGSGRRTWLDVIEEIRLLNHLRACGVSVAEPVPRKDGGYVSGIGAPEGTRYWALFQAAPGTPGDGDDPGKIRAFGEMAARMHMAADSLSPSYRRKSIDLHHLVDEHMPPIRKLMRGRRKDLALIENIARDCKRRIGRLLRKKTPEYGICHGDLHGGDVCYGKGNTPTLFDFDSSGYGWRALDIGVFLASSDWMNVSAKAERKRQRLLALFLEGYSRIRKLSERELAAIQLTPPIRHIFLMGHVLRYTTVYEGGYWANDAFIDWHMRWLRHWAGK